MLMVKTLEYIIGPNGKKLKSVSLEFSPRVCKESDTTGWLSVRAHTHTHTHTHATILMYVLLIFLKPMLYLHESIYALSSLVFVCAWHVYIYSCTEKNEWLMELLICSSYEFLFLWYPLFLCIYKYFEANTNILVIINNSFILF